MSNTKKSQTPEHRRRIYTMVLGGLLVAAIGVTAVVSLWNRPGGEPQVQESRPQTAREDGGQESLQHPSEDSQAEQANRPSVDPDSRIEANDPPESETQTGQESEAEESQAEPVDNEPAPTPWTAIDPAEQLMLWPVSGTVLKNYSVTTLIYDETLDQYATNDSISIQAAEAEEVLAAADGLVKEVGRSDRLGNYVVLDNGNGYETTYGQLSEEVPVAVGDTVLRGQTIGRISAPSWYSVVLGTHLTFRVSLNGTAVNPLDYLENVLED